MLSCGNICLFIKVLLNLKHQLRTFNDFHRSPHAN
jgi:hypothetical protein